MTGNKYTVVLAVFPSSIVVEITIYKQDIKKQRNKHKLQQKMLENLVLALSVLHTH